MVPWQLLYETVYNNQMEAMRKMQAGGSDVKKYAAAKIALQRMEIEKLQGYAREKATCPCCGQVDYCTDACTMAKDGPGHFQAMEEARRLLR